VPVIPGEDPNVWEAHRAGVVDSLAPVGLLEVNLAERAALLLWRLRRLARYEAENWTAELIDRGLTLYAGYTREPADRFTAAVRAELEGWAEELTRKIRRLEREAAAVARHIDGGTDRKQAAKLLPGDGRDERIAKYERHLLNLLTSTLHELERLQARREGETLPPPAVADLNVTLTAGGA